MTSYRRLSTVAAIGVAAVGGAAWMVASPGVASAATTATPCSAAARACVDLSTQQAWLQTNGVVDAGPVPVRSGSASYPTDPGTFHVSFKDADHVSSEYNAPMPYSVFFNGGDAFHEGSLTASSHGCVHLSHDSAVTFFGALQPGDEVQVVP